VCIALVLLSVISSVDAANVHINGASEVFVGASARSTEPMPQHHNNVKKPDQAVPMPAPSNLPSSASTLLHSSDGRHEVNT
jgi:hypothetical protein